MGQFGEQSTRAVLSSHQGRSPPARGRTRSLAGARRRHRPSHGVARMSFTHKIARLWRTIRRRRHEDAILREEIAGHLRALESEYRALGLSPQDARDAARRQFGNEAKVREDVREEMSFGAAERLAQDVRYATRTLKANAGFATFTILTLALGMGANTAAFSLVNGVLLRRLAFAAPDR